jgi:hypothetical protein
MSIQRLKRQRLNIPAGPMIVVAVLVSGILVFLANRSAYPLSTDPKTAKTQLTHIIPNGVALASATNRIKEMGFECKLVEGQSFEDEAPNEITQSRYIGDFVECVNQKSGLFGFPTYLWIVGIVSDENARVTNILVRISNRSLVMP